MKNIDNKKLAIGGALLTISIFLVVFLILIFKNNDSNEGNVTLLEVKNSFDSVETTVNETTSTEETSTTNEVTTIEETTLKEITKKETTTEKQTTTIVETTTKWIPPETTAEPTTQYIPPTTEAPTKSAEEMNPYWPRRNMKKFVYNSDGSANIKETIIGYDCTEEEVREFGKKCKEFKEAIDKYNPAYISVGIIDYFMYGENRHFDIRDYVFSVYDENMDTIKDFYYNEDFEFVEYTPGMFW